MICSICNKEIEKKDHWESGNNAEPINNGRCCDECNMNIVVPKRIQESRFLNGDCPECGMAYSFVFQTQFHKKGCTQKQSYGGIKCK